VDILAIAENGELHLAEPLPVGMRPISGRSIRPPASSRRRHAGR
jgi:hypothetical protein